MMANKIVDEGILLITNRIRGIVENAIDTTDGTISWTNGTAALAAVDDMAIFNADGAGGNKTITSTDFDALTNTLTIEFFISSVEGNAPGTITKIAIDNDGGTGKMFSEHKFAAITKNDSVEIYGTISVLISDDST